MKPDDGLIAALATPPGQSALALIRTSGKGSIEAVASLAADAAKVLSAPGHTVVRALLRDPEGRELDDVVLTVFRAPRSYTGEDSVEISCHGSLPGIEAIMAALYRCGFRQALGGEFTMRAFLNGKIDLTQAEAVQEIVSARSREAQVHALHRLGGALERRINGMKAALVQWMAVLSVQLDYAEDEVDMPDFDGSPLEAVRKELEDLLRSYALGQRYQNGVRVALAGKTNAGKSSLFNALVREDRAIVSEVHGTTRDYLEAQLVLGGIPVRLFDTAGLRETGEAIESEGIVRTGRVIESAAVLLYVVDGSLGLDDDDMANLARFAREEAETLIVWNKADHPGLLGSPAQVEAGGRIWPVLRVSARTMEGFGPFHEQLARMVRGRESGDESSLLLDNQRQYSLVARAAEAARMALAALEAGYGLDAVALDVKDAIDALGEITGEVTSDDILDAMFSGFCVGK